jgi:hypothetical protein
MTRWKRSKVWERRPAAIMFAARCRSHIKIPTAIGIQFW